MPSSQRPQPPSPDGLAIEARDLVRRFGSTEAVRGVSLDVARGSVFGLVGPDGAGKSTLIRMLATVLVPDAGDALVFGSSVVRAAREVKPRIGYMSQRFSLYGDLTVRENVDFFARLRGVPRAQRSGRAEQALTFAGLADFQNRPAQFLSGGMKQKLALAVTLMHDPDLLLLDEPTTGVDPVSRREFWRIIADLHRRGITVFVATPYMDEAERCSRIAFMDRGAIVLEGSPAQIKDRVPGRLVEIVVADQRAALPVLRATDGVVSVMVFGEALRVLVTQDGPSIDDLAAVARSAGGEISSSRLVPVDMETAFSHLIEQERGSR